MRSSRKSSSVFKRAYEVLNDSETKKKIDKIYQGKASKTDKPQNPFFTSNSQNTQQEFNKGFQYTHGKVDVDYENIFSSYKFTSKRHLKRLKGKRHSPHSRFELQRVPLRHQERTLPEETEEMSLLLWKQVPTRDASLQMLGMLRKGNKNHQGGAFSGGGNM